MLRIALSTAFCCFSVLSAAFPAAESLHDPTYLALRDLQLKTSFRADKLLIERDLGQLIVRDGTVTFCEPVLDRTPCAVVRGDGVFRFIPPKGTESDYLQFVTKRKLVEEEFQEAVIWFTDDTYREISEGRTPVQLDPKAQGVLSDLRKRLRRRQKEPRSLLESILHFDEIENIEARILTELYNPNLGRSFQLYITGKRHNDLRFFVRPDGALPQLLGNDQVALINLAPQERDEGIWYLGPTRDQLVRGESTRANLSRIDALHYRIEATLDGNDLNAIAELDFTALADGDRIIRLGLFPTLRVESVELDEKMLPFVQEPEDSDSSFHVVFEEPLERDHKYTIQITYAGKGVVEDAGGGNFAVGARTSWYPTAGSFSDRATFDLTYRFPKRYKLVSVGSRRNQRSAGKYQEARWISEIPIAVAGFNLGRFKDKSIEDSITNYHIVGYAARELPHYLRGAENIGGMSPARLLDNTLVETQNSIRLFTLWFGPSPFGRIAITQQPQFSFGQSWPGLVYLPLVAYLDATQRWRLFGGIDSGLTSFVQEVTPHEVAHQWWGHIVGWESYRDQWISEGFADFSASLFVEATESKARFFRFWEENRKTILSKNRFGHRANDVGPVDLGLRLSTFEAPDAYNRLVYAKGGFILHMIRRMMWDPESGDEEFKKMIQDFVKQNFNENASLVSLQRVLESHIPPRLNPDPSGEMDWFFDQWVRSTEIPSYRLVYSLESQPDGQILLRGQIEQAGVSARFKMPVPIYADFDGQMVFLGRATLIGNSYSPEFKLRLPQKPARVLINAYHDVLSATTECFEGTQRVELGFED